MQRSSAKSRGQDEPRELYAFVFHLRSPSAWFGPSWNLSRAQDRITHVLATCAYSLQRCIDLCDNSGLVLDPTAANEASDSLRLHLKTYSWLAAYFHRERLLLFKLRPKHHYVYHQAMQLKAWRININSFSTWDEEGFLGQIKAIATACHGATATYRVYQRYLLVLALMVQRHRELNDM